MGVIKNRVGQRFGRLTVIKLSHVKRQAFWECLCDCGNSVIVMSNNIKRTKSCGCLNKDVNAINNTTHGLTNTKIYNVYRSMKNRCNNPNDLNYINYGGRGITVCEEWNSSLEVFYMWAINNGYNELLTLERVDVNKGYSPENCVWATIKEQNRNKRNNKFLTANNRTQLLCDWIEETGISKSKISYRLKQGWTLEQIIEYYNKK